MQLSVTSYPALFKWSLCAPGAHSNIPSENWVSCFFFCEAEHFDKLTRLNETVSFFDGTGKLLRGEFVDPDFFQPEVNLQQKAHDGFFPLSCRRCWNSVLCLKQPKSQFLLLTIFLRIDILAKNQPKITTILTLQKHELEKKHYLLGGESSSPVLFVAIFAWTGCHPSWKDNSDLEFFHAKLGSATRGLENGGATFSRSKPLWCFRNAVCHSMSIWFHRFNMDFWGCWKNGCPPKSYFVIYIRIVDNWDVHGT